ncbi:arylesterase [Pikeienuella sp. HZG-20]|uniref:arylesterase n=1 Tax=Paludibacillus litoralis TaxID=3133267 RepID=UPI0030ECDA97
MMCGAVRYGVKGLLRKAALAAALAVCAVAAQAEIRLVALGDSLIQGYGLPAEEGFAPRLEAWLRANGAPDAVVVNAGVSGDTSAGGRARLDWALGGGADALIVELGGNDLLRAIDPAATRENIAAILSEAAARGLPVLLTGMKAPLNYGPDYKAEFDALYPELAEKYGALYDPFFLEGLPGKPALFQADGIHPNAAGVGKLVERFGPLALELIAKARDGR